MRPGDQLSPSVARAFSPPELALVRDLGENIPDGYVIVVEPPHGQLALVPRKSIRQYHRCWVIDPLQRRIYHL